jgi:hypothetical protein
VCVRRLKLDTDRDPSSALDPERYRFDPTPLENKSPQDMMSFTLLLGFLVSVSVVVGTVWAGDTNEFAALLRDTFMEFKAFVDAEMVKYGNPQPSAISWWNFIPNYQFSLAIPGIITDTYTPSCINLIY